MELFEEIQRLIALGTEGEYWDFKELWHDNKASFFTTSFVWLTIKLVEMPISFLV